MIMIRARTILAIFVLLVVLGAVFYAVFVKPRSAFVEMEGYLYFSPEAVLLLSEEQYREMLNGELISPDRVIWVEQNEAFGSLGALIGKSADSFEPEAPTVVYVKVEGELMTDDEYGHLGKYKNKLVIRRILDARLL